MRLVQRLPPPAAISDIMRIDLAVLTFLATLPFAGNTLAQPGFCLLHPVDPPCCPIPCPVGDGIRLPELAHAVDTLQQMLSSERQAATMMQTLWQGVGNIGSLPSMVRADVTQMMPGLLKGQMGFQGMPLAAAQSIKQTLFTTAGASQSSSDITAKQQLRSTKAAAERAEALAMGLSHIQTLPSMAQIDQSTTTAATQAHQLRDDASAGAQARLAWMADTASLGQILAAAASQLNSSAFLQFSQTAVAPYSAAAESDGTPLSAAPPAPQAFPMDGLHDQRLAAQALLARYPALQYTVAAANMTQGFEDAAGRELQKQLRSAGITAPGAFETLQSSLLAIDGSSWQDSGAKDKTAAAAAAKLTAAIGLQSDSAIPLDADALRQAMIAWLDSRKQNFYWQGLARSANANIAALDRRLSEISDHIGIDVTGDRATQLDTAVTPRSGGAR